MESYIFVGRLYGGDSSGLGFEFIGLRDFGVIVWSLGGGEVCMLGE